MQLCLEGWDQALALFFLTNLQSYQVLSLQMSRGKTPSTEKPPQPTQRCATLLVPWWCRAHLRIFTY